MDQEIIDKLKNNNESLTELDLSSNQINNINVFNILKYNSSLTYLKLDHNQITNLDVLEVLKENNTLNYLYLDYKLKEKNKELLKDILNYNFSLISLY